LKSEVPVHVQQGPPLADVLNQTILDHSVTYRSFATTLSQLKICDFSGGTFKGFEVL
jgi:hypothetical protein